MGMIELVCNRPTELEDPAISGHWDGDLITGSQNTHMATLVERQSRLTLFVKMQDKDTISVVTHCAGYHLGSRNKSGPAQRIDGRYHGAGLFL